jgi:hypothetical protein
MVCVENSGMHGGRRTYQSETAEGASPADILIPGHSFVMSMCPSVEGVELSRPRWQQLAEDRSLQFPEGY